MNFTESKPQRAAVAGPHSRTALLRLEHVCKNYVTDGQVVHAVDDVSVKVHPGEFLALVGRSGCGKSTLLNLAGAMDFPSTGTVWLDGESTSQLDDAGLTRVRREKVGFIFQSFQLLNTLSVSRTLSCRCCSRGLAKPVIVRKSSWSWWTLANSLRACRTSSRADRCSVSPSRVPWCTGLAGAGG